MTEPTTLRPSAGPVIERIQPPMGEIARRAFELEVVIPALNEESRLPTTLERTVGFLSDRPWDSGVVVVDNGSVDRTVERVRRFEDSPVPVSVIGCAETGKGAAIRRGFLTGTSAVVGFMDADLATPVEMLDDVMSAFDRGADVVIASRNAPGARRVQEQPAVRRLGGAVFRSLTRTVVPGIADTQCGFKFLRGPSARRLASETRLDGFAFDVELLARARAAGLRIEELPVDWTDVPGSKFDPVTDGMRTVLDLVTVHQLVSTRRLR